MSDNINATEQNDENTTPALGFDPTGQEPLDLEAYYLSARAALENDADAQKDLDVLFSVLQANISFFAQTFGIVLVVFDAGDGQLVILPAQLR